MPRLPRRRRGRGRAGGRGRGLASPAPGGGGGGTPPGYPPIGGRSIPTIPNVNIGGQPYQPNVAFTGQAAGPIAGLQSRGPGTMNIGQMPPPITGFNRATGTMITPGILPGNLSDISGWDKWQEMGAPASNRVSETALRLGQANPELMQALAPQQGFGFLNRFLGDAPGTAGLTPTFGVGGGLTGGSISGPQLRSGQQYAAYDPSFANWKSPQQRRKQSGRKARRAAKREKRKARFGLGV